MVLPLLVVPLVAAAASTGGGVAIAAIVPTALAATYGAFFLAKKYFEHNMRSNIKRTSEAFQRYHQMTQAHINKAKDGIDVIQFKLTKVAEAVNAATAETENAVQKLNHGVEALKEVSLNGVNATQLAKETVDALAVTSETCKETVLLTQETLNDLNQLGDVLQLKESDLQQTREAMKALQAALDAQINVNAQLDGLVKSLTADNGQLKSSLQEMEKELDALVPLVNELNIHRLFYKQNDGRNLKEKEVAPVAMAFKQ